MVDVHNKKNNQTGKKKKKKNNVKELTWHYDTAQIQRNTQ